MIIRSCNHGVCALLFALALTAAACSDKSDAAGAPAEAAAGDVAAKLGLLAPKGVEIGKSVKEVRTALLKAGFAELPQKCLFDGKGIASVTISTVEEDACADDKPVRLIYYVRRLDPPMSDGEVVRAIDREAGSGHVCTAGGDAEDLGSCVWNDPGKLPKVGSIVVLAQNNSLSVTQQAVADLKTPNSRKGNFSKAFDPLAPVDGIDPVAPGGLALGLDVVKASRELREAGFLPTMKAHADGVACAWRYERRQEVEITVNLRASTAAHAESCAAGARIWNVDYRRRDMRRASIAGAPAPEGIVRKWRTALRPETETGACATSPAPIDCTFNAPRAIKGARLARLTYQLEEPVVAVSVQIVGTR